MATIKLHNPNKNIAEKTEAILRHKQALHEYEQNIRDFSHRADKELSRLQQVSIPQIQTSLKFTPLDFQISNAQFVGAKYTPVQQKQFQIDQSKAKQLVTIDSILSKGNAFVAKMNYLASSSQRSSIQPQDCTSLTTGRLREIENPGLSPRVQNTTTRQAPFVKKHDYGHTLKKYLKDGNITRRNFGLQNMTPLLKSRQNVSQVGRTIQSNGASPDRKNITRPYEDNSYAERSQISQQQSADRNQSITDMSSQKQYDCRGISVLAFESGRKPVSTNQGPRQRSNLQHETGENLRKDIQVNVPSNLDTKNLRKITTTVDRSCLASRVSKKTNSTFRAIQNNSSQKLNADLEDMYQQDTVSRRTSQKTFLRHKERILQTSQQEDSRDDNQVNRLASEESIILGDPQVSRLKSYYTKQDKDLSLRNSYTAAEGRRARDSCVPNMRLKVNNNSPIIQSGEGINTNSLRNSDMFITPKMNKEDLAVNVSLEPYTIQENDTISQKAVANLLQEKPRAVESNSATDEMAQLQNQQPTDIIKRTSADSAEELLIVPLTHQLVRYPMNPPNNKLHPSFMRLRQQTQSGNHRFQRNRPSVVGGFNMTPEMSTLPHNETSIGDSIYQSIGDRSNTMLQIKKTAHFNMNRRKIALITQTNDQRLNLKKVNQKKQILQQNNNKSSQGREPPIIFLGDIQHEELLKVRNTNQLNNIRNDYTIVDRVKGLSPQQIRSSRTSVADRQIINLTVSSNAERTTRQMGLLTVENKLKQRQSKIQYTKYRNGNALLQGFTQKPSEARQQWQDPASKQRLGSNQFEQSPIIKPQLKVKQVKIVGAYESVLENYRKSQLATEQLSSENLLLRDN